MLNLNSGTLEWLLSLNFTLGWLTKGMHKRSATLERLSSLNSTLGWPTQGMLRWNGSFLLNVFPSGGSHRVCYIAMRDHMEEQHRGFITSTIKTDKEAGRVHMIHMD